MKQILLMILVALMGCGNKETVEKPEPPKAAPEKLIANPIVEKAIRKHHKKLKGELTEADLEKVTKLLSYGVSPLTDVKGLEKLTHLMNQNLYWNPKLTKAQIDQLQKALPKCEIIHSAKK